MSTTARELSRTLRDFQLAESLAARIAAAEAEATAPGPPAATGPAINEPNTNSANEIGPMASFGEAPTGPTTPAVDRPAVGPVVSPGRQATLADAPRLT